MHNRTTNESGSMTCSCSEQGHLVEVVKLRGGQS